MKIRDPIGARSAPEKIALFECFTVQKHEKIDSQKVMRIRDPIEFRKFGQVNKGPHANSEFRKNHVNKGPHRGGP